MLAPIEKVFSFYDKDWNLVTQKVTYILYMKPDCQNFLVVSQSIETVNSSSIDPLTFDWNTVILVSGRVPIIVPWQLFFGPSGFFDQNSGGAGVVDGAVRISAGWANN